MPRKHALLIGVNNYPQLGEQYKLWGCVNDARLVGSVLENYFGFESENVVYLLDEAATEAGIRGAMAALTERVGQDDVVVFHFSGHGSRRRTTDPDEASGKDSTIMPYDSGRRPHPNLDIPDNDIQTWIESVTEKTANVTLVFDCCHSGTITRDVSADRTRSVPDDDRSLDELGLTLRSVGDTTRSAPATRGPGGFMAASDKYLVMSACRDDERAREFKITRGDESFLTGALTHYLTEALTSAVPGSTFRDVFEHARNRIHARYDNQHPQIEGTQDRELFGTRDLAPMRFVAIEKVDGEKITLRGGAAHGLRVGSLWRAYPPGAKEPGESFDADLRIESVSALSSQAVIVEQPGVAVAEGRCVEIEGAPDQFVMHVDIQSGDSDASALRSAIESASLLATREDGATDFTVYACGPRNAADASDPAPQMPAIESASWVCTNVEGQLAMPVIPREDADAVDRLVANLSTLARYRNALTLDNPQSRLNVEFNIFRHADDDWQTANGGGSIFEDGDRIGLEIVNHEAFPVFFSILDFELAGGISVLFPEQRGGEQLAAGNRIRLAMDDNALRLAWEAEVEGDQAAETFKAFFTRDETDFRWLSQSGTRSISGTSRLDALFSAAYFGPTTRAGRWDSAPQDTSTDDWRAISRGFQVRKKH
ncbi:MAG: caspase family protein [Pseudomonadota bacterium]